MQSWMFLFQKCSQTQQLGSFACHQETQNSGLTCQFLVLCQRPKQASSSKDLLGIVAFASKKYKKSTRLYKPQRLQRSIPTFLRKSWTLASSTCVQSLHQRNALDKCTYRDSAMIRIVLYGSAAPASIWSELLTKRIQITSNNVEFVQNSPKFVVFSQKQC